MESVYMCIYTKHMFSHSNISLALMLIYSTYLTPWPLVRERTTPTERLLIPLIELKTTKQTNSVAFSPQANYTD
jgi:hypothetical protein